MPEAASTVPIGRQRWGSLPSESPDTWLDWAATDGPFRADRAAAAVKRRYVKAGFPEPRYALVADSPLSGGIFGTFFREPGDLCGDFPDYDPVSNSLVFPWGPPDRNDEAPVDPRWALACAMERLADSRLAPSSACMRLMAAIWFQAAEDARSPTLDPILECAWQQLNRQFWGESTTPLCPTLREQLRLDMRREGRSQLIAQLLAPPFRYAWWKGVEAVRARCPESAPQFERLLRMARYGWWWTPFPDVAILQRPPCELHLNAAGAVHRDGGPAVRYRDGFAVWMLNGVRVPRWLAETRDTQIDPRRILDIRNVDVRREFVRKVGADRLCYSLNAVCLDRQGNYELLNLDLGDGRVRPYLKMLNPSIGTWHVEGVAPGCRTVAQALAWRNLTAEPPEVLT